MVPVAPVREHVVGLMAGAVGIERIAEAAQVSRSAVLDVYFGPRGAAKAGRERDPLKRTMRESNARRILAVTSDDIDAAVVPAVGTVRRLRALVAIGWTESQLAERLGMQVGNFSRLILGMRERVLIGTYVATCELFSQAWAVPLSGSRADAARRLAKRHRWLGPLAWDDIDDPDDAAAESAPEDAAIDELAVDLAVSGNLVPLSPAERREAVRRLHAGRLSDGAIADRLHVTDRTVLRIRQELDLPAFDQNDLTDRGAA